MRRWIRYQKILNKKRWFEPDREKNGPLTLFDFAMFDDAIDAALVDEKDKGGWRISDDSVIGGYSKGTMELLYTPDDYKQYRQGVTPVSLLDRVDEIKQQEERANKQIREKDYDENSSSNESDGRVANKISSDEDEANKFVPFIRWKGEIDTRVKEGSDVQRSGFCAIRSPEFPFSGFDLEGRYNGLELMCRSDGRQYSFMLKVESLIPGDMYQCAISIPPTIPPTMEVCPETGGKFDKCVLLFDHFFVTHSGRMRVKQRDLDNSIRIQSIGISLMDGRDGPFEFDLARIRAVNYDERGVIGDAD